MVDEKQNPKLLLPKLLRVGLETTGNCFVQILVQLRDQDTISHIYGARVPIYIICAWVIHNTASLLLARI